MPEYLLSADVAAKIPIRHVVIVGYIQATLHSPLGTFFLSILVFRTTTLISPPYFYFSFFP